MFYGKLPGTPEEAGSLMSSVAVPKGRDDGDGGGGFMDWWSNDETQIKLGSMLQGFGDIFGGMAGMPLGGGDTSSLQRGAIRAGQRPGEARRRIQVHRFGKYIDQQIATEKDPHRVAMLQAAKLNPSQAGQILAMESPMSKEARTLRLAEVEFGYKERLTKMEVEGRRAAAYGKYGLSAKQISDVGRAASWYHSLGEVAKKSVDTGTFSLEKFLDPEFAKNITLLHTPEYGLLWKRQQKGVASGGSTNPPRVDLSGTTTVTDPDTGEEMTVKNVDAVEEAMFGEGEPDPQTEELIEYSIAKQREEDDAASTEKAGPVAESMGLNPYGGTDSGVGITDEQTVANLEGADYAYDEPAPSVSPAASASPGSVAPGSVGSGEGGFHNWMHEPNEGLYRTNIEGEREQYGRWKNPGEMVRSGLMALESDPLRSKKEQMSMSDFFGIGDIRFTDPDPKPPRRRYDNTQDYLTEKRRKSKIQDEKMRKQVEQRRKMERLGF
jgi:hypothetical protein